MRRQIPVRSIAHQLSYRGIRGLGWPVLPDFFHTAAGGFESFSPNTPDATVVQMLTQQGQQLPPDLAAAWAAAQSGAQSSGATGSAAASASPTPAVTPSGSPVSTQTGSGLGVKNVTSVAPGIFLLTMSDNSAYFGDINGTQVSYTPPPPIPVVTPAQSQVTQTVVPAAPGPVGNPFNGTSGGLMTVAPSGTPVSAITPSGSPVSTTNGAVSPVVLPGSSDIMLGTFDLSSFLKGSMIGGIPNWILLAGGAALLFMGSGTSSHRRR